MQGARIGLIGLVAMLMAAPLQAERLVFDHRLSPPLKEVLDSGRSEMVDFDSSNPRNLVDIIAVRGNSAKDWTEALVIIVRKPNGKISSPAAWRAELERDALRACPASFANVGQSETTLTFERRSTGCQAGYPADALYFVTRGKRSLYLLSVLSKDGLTEKARSEWLALFGSARIE